MKNQDLELHSPLPKSFKVCKERTMEKRKSKQSEEKQRGQQLQSSFALLEHFKKSIFYMLYTISKLWKSRIQRFKPLWMLCDGLDAIPWKFLAPGSFQRPILDKLLDFYPLVISYELLEGEVFNSKFCINPLEPISMAIERVESNGAVAGEGATSTVKQPLRVTCDLHHKFEMKIPHEDQSSHYDHEKDKFAYLSMRDRIELGKRQVQQSQWGSKYGLNGDNTYEHTVAIPTVRDMYGYQSSYTSSWNNHPNLTTQPQPQPSMSTSSLEQAILKISKVMEDFVGEQQNINSHLNEKIDNMESSINVRMEGVYNDLSLRIEKVQDSIEKLTNLDIARGKRKLPPQPHHNLQGTNAKRSRKVLKIDTLVGDCYDNSMDQPSIENRKVQDDKGLPESFKASTSLGKRRETNSLGPNGKDANFVWDPGGIQHEVGMMLAKIEVMVETKENRGEKPKTGNSHHPILATESIGSNGARFGVETNKLWPFEDDCAKLNGNVAAAPHFATVGHVFGALSGAQIMQIIFLFEA
ncbi:hypothetical protein CK203_101107 [Vitis vinifera]|uniref:Uncharacterized protein n=1 Tax=Vitis vinifera TaxID=29760 RepID=A0A438C532_VITVI|nr:hypothetical protein CK203_101107 [Vitis vinifera]